MYNTYEISMCVNQIKQLHISTNYNVYEKKFKTQLKRNRLKYVV